MVKIFGEIEECKRVERFLKETNVVSRFSLGSTLVTTLMFHFHMQNI